MRTRKDANHAEIKAALYEAPGRGFGGRLRCCPAVDADRKTTRIY